MEAFQGEEITTDTMQHFLLNVRSMEIWFISREKNRLKASRRQNGLSYNSIKLWVFKRDPLQEIAFSARTQNPTTTPK